mgnify:CR=1
MDQNANFDFNVLVHKNFYGHTNKLYISDGICEGLTLLELDNL